MLHLACNAKVAHQSLKTLQQNLQQKVRIKHGDNLWQNYITVLHTVKAIFNFNSCCQNVTLNVDWQYNHIYTCVFFADFDSCLMVSTPEETFTATSPHPLLPSL